MLCVCGFLFCFWVFKFSSPPPFYLILLVWFFFWFFFFFPPMCLLKEIYPASHLPYQQRCNHPKVTASISFPPKETATGNGESSSEGQYLDLRCSFRIPTSLLAPFLCSKMTPELRVNFFPACSPGLDCCKPSSSAGRELSFQKLPSFPTVTRLIHQWEAKRWKHAVSRGERHVRRAFPSALQREEALFRGFSLRYKIVKDHSLPCLFNFFFPLRDGQNQL